MEMMMRLISLLSLLIWLLCLSGLGCSIALDLSSCEADADCGPGFVCTDDLLCRQTNECSEQSDCAPGLECSPDGTCEPENATTADCTDHGDCPEDQLCSERGECQAISQIQCDDDDQCGPRLICEQQSCVEPPICQEIGLSPALVWSDFEDPELTNLGGFQEPIDDGLVATFVDDEEDDSSPILQLDYDVTPADSSTGFRLFAFPPADIGDYDHLVIRARANEPRPLTIELRDDEADGADGFAETDIAVQEQWREFIIPLSELDYPTDSERLLNLEVLQAIDLLIRNDGQSADQGTIFVDHVGFSKFPPPIEAPDFIWSDFSLEEFTNVEGFRDPINDLTEVTEPALDDDVDPPTITLNYRTTELRQSTGYNLFAFPHADVSDQDFFVMRARARRTIYNLEVQFADHRHLGEGQESVGLGVASISPGPQWQWLVIPLDTLSTPEGIEELPDFSVLQLIALVFDYEQICPQTGELEIDTVGFISAQSQDEADDQDQVDDGA